MSTRAPVIIVDCDGWCGATLEVELAPLADGEQWMLEEDSIRDYNWHALGMEHYCAKCYEAEVYGETNEQDEVENSNGE